MNVPEHIMAEFVNGSWAKAFLMLCDERAKKAMKELLSAPPDQIATVAKAQATYEIFATLLPGLPKEVNDFLAAAATAKGKP